MPWVNVPTYRVSLEGHLGSGEIFATTFWCSGTVGTPNAQAAADGIVAALGTNGTGVSTMTSRLAGLLATADGWDRVRVYTYASGSNHAVSSGVASIPSGVGQNSRACAFQCSLVATIQTAKSGRSYRGRMYLPLAVSPATTGMIQSTIVDKAATAIGDLFGYIKNNTIDKMSHPVVWSSTHDHAEPVTAVRVDSKVDTMRSRSAKIQADYAKTYSGLG